MSGVRSMESILTLTQRRTEWESESERNRRIRVSGGFALALEVDNPWLWLSGDQPMSRCRSGTGSVRIPRSCSRRKHPPVYLQCCTVAGTWACDCCRPGGFHSSYSQSHRWPLQASISPVDISQPAGVCFRDKLTRVAIKAAPHGVLLHRTRPDHPNLPKEVAMATPSIPKSPASVHPIEGYKPEISHRERFPSPLQYLPQQSALGVDIVQPVGVCLKDKLTRWQSKRPGTVNASPNRT